MSLEQRLENPSRVISLIGKADKKHVNHKKVVTFLKKKGLSDIKINKAYEEYYKQEGMYKITFNHRPLGFSIKPGPTANESHNQSLLTLVSSIQDERLIKLGLQIASKVHNIDGKCVYDWKYKDISRETHSLSSKDEPFYMVFKKVCCILATYLNISSMFIHNDIQRWCLK